MHHVCVGDMKLKDCSVIGQIHNELRGLTATTLTEVMTQVHVVRPNNKDIYFKSVKKRMFPKEEKNARKKKHDSRQQTNWQT